MLIVWLETEGDTSESYIAGMFERSASSLPFLRDTGVSFHSLPFEGQQVSLFIHFHLRDNRCLFLFTSVFVGQRVSLFIHFRLRDNGCLFSFTSV